ncbi:diguanylate cyclase/phosphodiesterase with PAS/PAC sensor(s) [Lachnospiraceae bacterium KM106-2]|nr:diguanylate cyclase/phosphodiesterase with PAS/PAC sensor(s) [Lachnospiraceae bacterium KM106-2]
MRNKLASYRPYMIVAYCILIFIIGHGIKSVDLKKYDVKDLKNGWNVTYKGRQYKNQVLSKFSFEKLKRGDTIELTVQLPKNEMNTPVISLYSVYSELYAYVDNRLIYQYSNQDYLQPGGYHALRLAGKYEGKTLRIHIVATKDSAFSKIKTPQMGLEYDIYRDILSTDFPFFLTCFILIMFGIMFGCITAVSSLKYPELFLLFHVSFFSIMIGIWGLASSGALHMFINSYGEIKVIEFTALYFCPMSILAIFEILLLDHPRLRKIIRIFLLVDAVFLAVSLFLHWMRITHISQTVIISYVLYSSQAIICVILTIQKRRLAPNPDRVPIIGVIVLFITGFIDCYQYIGNHFYNMTSADLLVSYLPFGGLVFVGSIILYYGNILMRNIYEKAEKKRLLDLAYHDVLTNLYNRMKFTEQLESWKAQQIPYAILSFDLNHLKELNDTKGHQFGDWLIVKFSNILHQSFANQGLVCRIGGDEFAVLMERTNEEQMEEHLNHYQEVLDLSNEVSNEIYCTAAYGYAFSSEVSGLGSSYRDVVNLADARMYEMKQRQREIRK